MFAKDRRFFTALFKRDGAIDKFHNPNYKRNYVVAEGLYISKRIAVAMIRDLLPRYRTYKEEKQLIDVVYAQLNIAKQRLDLFDERLILDPNIRSLFLQEQPILSEQAHKELKDISELPEQAREQTANIWVEKLQKREVAETPVQTQPQEKQTPVQVPSKTAPTPSPQPQIVNTQIQDQTEAPQSVAPTIPPIQEKVAAPGFVKDALSRVQIGIKKLISRYLSPTKIASLFTGLVGAIVGFGVGGRVGAAVGGGVGVAVPTIIKNGGGEMILNRGRGALDTGENLLTNLSRLDNFTGKFTVFSRSGLILVIALILALTFFTSGGGEPPQNLQAGGLISSDLSQCQFFRGDRKPPGVAYQSPLLLSYFQKAESLTTVPAALLASIARVESPTVTSKADSDLLNLASSQGCPRSSTDALGIMQIQPKDTTGYSARGVALGASFLGKEVDQLTENDYCDPQQSIILAAGFILSKLGATKWDPAWTNDKDIIYSIANGYYGCLEYGTSEKTASGTTKCAGPYNYGADLWESLQACKASTTAPATPAVSTDAKQLHDDILRNFSIDFDMSLDYSYMKWAWEKLWNVSNTRFISLIRASSSNIISVNAIADSSSVNEQTSCSGISIRAKSRSTGQPYPESLFKVVFIHELSHIIENCNPNSNKNQLQQIINQEGYLTSYSSNASACVGSNNLNEDYAETLAYFLNPEFPEQSLGIGSLCEPASPVNPYNRNKSLHQKFAQDLLGPYSGLK